MVGLLASGAPRFAGLRSAPVLRLRQFVAGIVDDIPLRMVRRKRDFKAGKRSGSTMDNDQQKAFEQPGDEDAAIPGTCPTGASPANRWESA